MESKAEYSKILRKYKRIAKELDVEVSKSAESLIEHLWKQNWLR